MAITLDQLLALAGRLDDTTGFDSPRERFRRFLLDYARDWPAMRAFLTECQYSPTGVHQLAMRDLVVAMGSSLGFAVEFGTHWLGSWSVRPHLRLILDVKTGPVDTMDIEPWRQAVSFDGDPSATGLCIVAPLFMRRDQLADAIAKATPPPSLRMTTLRGLMTLADMVESKRLLRRDAPKLVASDLSVDFLVDVLGQSNGPATVAATPATATPSPAESPSVVAPTGNEPEEYWLAPVTADYATRPEEFLERVVGRRLMFGVSDVSGPRVRPGDLMCFHIAGKGVVGHARIATAAEGAGASGLRDAHRFRQVLQLQDLVLTLDAPVPADPESQLRLRTAQLTPGQGQRLVRISRESFRVMTTPASNEPARDSRLSG